VCSAVAVLVPCAAGCWPAAQPPLLWVVYTLFSSHIDIAWHTCTAALLVSVYVRAGRREYANITQQMETIWRIRCNDVQISS
jgi:hypothetical protein